MKILYTQDILDKLYKDIYEFRTLFKQPINIKPGEFNANDHIHHMSLAVEELTELAVADTLVEQADALTDLLYVNLGRIVHRGYKNIDDDKGLTYINELIFQVANALNIDLLKCFDIVHESNMSKLCKNHKEYKKTVEFYRQQGIKVVPESTVMINNKNPSESVSGIIVKCAEDITTESKFIKEGKVLKNVYYKEAMLSPVPKLK